MQQYYQQLLQNHNYLKRTFCKCKLPTNQQSDFIGYAIPTIGLAFSII